MQNLYTRSGTEYTGRTCEREGKTGYRYQQVCSRCGGAGGAERWRHTGWKCYDCAGTGKGRIAFERLYTAEELAKLNAAKEKRDAKREAKRAAEAAAAKAEADAKRDAWIAAHAELVAGIKRHASSEFVASLAQAIETRGELTERQIAAAQAWIDRADARIAAAAKSGHVGAIGERVRLTVTVERIIDITPYSQPYGFGRRYLALGRDADGNVITYKGGSVFAAEGETVSIVATVQEHGEYNATKQTRVNRPRVV